MNPSTVVPPGVRVITSIPPTAQATTDRPMGGAGTLDWKTAMAATAQAVHSATASAPQRVERRQNSAAISSGDSAA